MQFGILRAVPFVSSPIHLFDHVHVVLVYVTCDLASVSKSELVFDSFIIIFISRQHTDAQY